MLLSDLLRLSVGLDSLDGYQDVVTVNDTEQVVKRPYVFGSSKTSWNIAKNKRVVKGHVQDYNDTRDALIKELSDGGVEIPEDNKEKIVKFNERHTELLKQEVSIDGILKLKLNDLVNEREEKGKEGAVKKLSNPIPASVLEVLMDIIEE